MLAPCWTCTELYVLSVGSFGGSVVGTLWPFLQIVTNFACSVCLDLHSLICYSLGRNEGLTLNGWTVSTNRRPADKQSYFSLCMHTYLLSSSGNTLFSHPVFICSLFYKKRAASSSFPDGSLVLNEMQHWQADLPLLHLVDRRRDPTIGLCLPGHLPHPASCSILPFALTFLAPTQQ